MPFNHEMEFQCRSCNVNLASSTPITLPCGYTVCTGCLSAAIGGGAATLTEDASNDVDNVNSSAESTDVQRSVAVQVPTPRSNVAASQAASAGSFNSLDEALRLRRSSSNVSSSSPSSPIAQFLPNDEKIVYDCPVKDCSFKRHLYRNERVDFLVQHLLQVKEPKDDDFDCPVCFDLLCDPTTTTCGHTLCRRCLLDSMDNSTITCPQCRRPLPNYNVLFNRPANNLLVETLKSKFAEAYAARKLAIEGLLNSTDAYVPVFVCSLAFPRTPIFLHIFEPRYRLMIHRAMQGNKKFGIALPTRNGRGYMEYGTMIDITSVQAVRSTHEEPGGLPRYLVQGVGTFRFKVKERAVVDDYNIALVERLEDEDDELVPADPEEESVASLMTYCLSHVQAVLSQMTLVERRQFAASHGEMPSEPSEFSFWLATILPVYDYQKYSLLKMTSAKERLQKLAGWIREELEAPRRNRCDLM